MICSSCEAARRSVLHPHHVDNNCRLAISKTPSLLSLLLLAIRTSFTSSGYKEGPVSLTKIILLHQINRSSSKVPHHLKESKSASIGFFLHIEAY